MTEGVKAGPIRWLMVMIILWPLGCSTIQPSVQKKMPPPSPAPVSGKIEQIPEHQPQETPPREVRLPSPPPPPPEEKYFTHEIKWPGEDLGSIAHWYTGFAKNWERLVEVNPGIDPRRINIGDSVLIPEDLLKTRRPMPIDFLSSKAKKKKAPPPPPVIHPVKPVKIELFGPIDTEPQTGGAGDDNSPLPLETIE
ncbi:MAG: hypothetical protein U9Q05_13415 [Thermodesulfobacteriota bacterium]|nr:hypothetical protein [Thermodesulfobacteriota bacterium]